LEAGVIGNPEKIFQMKLGISFMLAMGLAFVAWLNWGIFALLLAVLEGLVQWQL
jgi:hypothetical protein